MFLTIFPYFVLFFRSMNFLNSYGLNTLSTPDVLIFFIILTRNNKDFFRHWVNLCAKFGFVSLYVFSYGGHTQTHNLTGIYQKTEVDFSLDHYISLMHIMVKSRDKNSIR